MFPALAFSPPPARPDSARPASSTRHKPTEGGTWHTHARMRSASPMMLPQAHTPPQLPARLISRSVVEGVAGSTPQEPSVGAPKRISSPCRSLSPPAVFFDVEDAGSIELDVVIPALCGATTWEREIVPQRGRK